MSAKFLFWFVSAQYNPFYIKFNLNFIKLLKTFLIIQESRIWTGHEIQIPLTFI